MSSANAQNRAGGCTLGNVTKKQNQFILPKVAKEQEQPLSMRHTFTQVSLW